MGVLSSSSLLVDAAQTASGNTPDAGTVSDIRVYNGNVVSGSNPPMGGSVIYSVLPNTEYYIRAFVPSSSQVYTYINFFKSYPSLGSHFIPVESSESFRKGDFIFYHFTTSSSTYFVTLSFRFNDSVTNYETVRSFIQSASIGDTVGLYTPLSNQSKMELNASFDISFLVTCSASGGVGSYGFSIDVIDNSNNVTRLYTNVSTGEYFISILSVDDDNVIRVTVSDSLGNSSVKDFSIDSLPEFVKQLPPPDVDLGLFPKSSLPVDDGVADIIVDSWSVIPSEITALLIPVVLFSLIGWWLHK